MNVWRQTLVAPLVTTILYIIVFQLARGAGDGTIRAGDFEGIAFNDFLAPGLLVMAMLTNSFANSSSSLVQSKILGTNVDFMMPPLSPKELTIGFVTGAATRGMAVALAAGICIHLSGLASLQIQNLWAVLWFGVCASVMLGAIGAMTGIWADKFDNNATVTNFIIVPLTFLSGTFYDINRLPDVLKNIAFFDPFFYLIDGFRYGFLDKANSDIAIGAVVSGVLAFVCCMGVWAMFKTGYKLKA
jgi:ABC-2 type transport system permease protein